MLKINFNTVFEHSDDFSDEFFAIVVWPLYDAVNLREDFKKNCALRRGKLCDL